MFTFCNWQDGQDGKENHATKVTKIPKTKRRKYGMNETLVWTVDNSESQSHFCVNGLYVHSTFELPIYNREKLFQKEQLLLDTLTDFTQICFAILSCGGY